MESYLQTLRSQATRNTQSMLYTKTTPAIVKERNHAVALSGTTRERCNRKQRIYEWMELSPGRKGRRNHRVTTKGQVPNPAGVPASWNEHRREPRPPLRTPISSSSYLRNILIGYFSYVEKARSTRVPYRNGIRLLGRSSRNRPWAPSSTVVGRSRQSGC